MSFLHEKYFEVVAASNSYNFSYSRTCESFPNPREMETNVGNHGRVTIVAFTKRCVTTGFLKQLESSSLQKKTKTNIDTKNDGLEDGSPASNMASFWVASC